MLQGYYCDDPYIMYPNNGDDPEFNQWVDFDEAKQLQVKLDNIQLESDHILGEKTPTEIRIEKILKGE